jgi:hypothetical protein
MKRSKVWDAFLRIPNPATSDIVPAAEAPYLQARGVEASAPEALRLLRTCVAPLMNRLEHLPVDYRYFLVHDKHSGVPTKEDGAFIHLHVAFTHPVALRDDVRACGYLHWNIITPAKESDRIAGVDTSIMQVTDGLHATRRLLHAQSSFVLELLDTFREDADPLKVLNQIRQQMHYFANMIQMRIA